jgi:hypothetical protein
MSQTWLLLLRGLFGGVMVVAFAVIAELVKPKVFSGLFSAAPSIAIAGLLVAAFTTGPAKASDAAVGMFGGALAIVASTILAAHAVQRYGAVIGSAAAWLTWALVAGAVYAGFIR